MTTSFHLTPFLYRIVNDITDKSQSFNDIRELFLKDLDEEKKKKEECDRYAIRAKVLILTNRSDLESDLVGFILLNKGIDYLRINVEDIIIPNEIKVIIKTEGGEGQSEIMIVKKDQTVNLSEIEVVFLRHFDIDDADFDNEGKNNNNGDKNDDNDDGNHAAFSNKFMRQQWTHIFEIIKDKISKARWISNSDAVEKLLSNRARQLTLAKSVGKFDIPDTLITNDADKVRKFYYDHDSDVIVKALHEHFVVVKNKVYTIHAQRLLESGGDLSELDKSLTLAPCIFQKRIEKKTELRITVVGEEIFAAKLNLNSKQALEEDIHLCKNEDDIDIEPFFDLTQDVKSRILALMHAFGLEYGSLDFIVDNNDKLIFLEVNPTGAWAYVEDATGMPITEAVTNLIIMKQNTTSSISSSATAIRGVEIS